MSAKKLISVVIATYNRKNLLKNCLRALFDQSLPSKKYEIIVVDDGSTDGTKDFIKTYQKSHPSLRYLRQPHLGTTKARNLGLKKAKGEIIAFTDDDCIPKKNWFEEILRAFKKSQKLLGVEGKTITDGQATPLTSQIVNLKGGAYQSCNIAYKKKVLEKIGGFDEKFTLPHCDDVDLALRVLKFGSIYFSPKAVVVHPPRPTTFKQELGRIKHIASEFYLFLKHPDYFKEKYGHKNIFWQVVFKNSIWIRLFHLKYYFNWIRKNPRIYLKFFLRTTLEIGLIILLTPRFWLEYRKIKRWPEKSLFEFEI